jgi:alkylation response protein AidB-like acyl-CoA dehydrogenase
MPSKVLSRRDIDFLLYEWLDVEALVSRERFAEHSKATFDGILDVASDLAESEFAPHNADSDRSEPQFDGERVEIIPDVASALRSFAATGLIGATFDEAVGGIQLPHVVDAACFSWFQAANTATTSYAMLTKAAANLLITHGTPSQVETFVPSMLSGRFFGTMCLSEPQAGSSLADVMTRATRDGDEHYRIHGNKMWISGGDHELSENIVHMVLARVDGAPAGVKGLSLFIVPRFLVAADGTNGDRNDVVLAGVNHKMGFRGTVNTLLNFGEGRYDPLGSTGAVGYLIGEENRGLDYMFAMMNEARISVGCGAAAVGYTGYLHALDYARVRLQGRVTGRPEDPQVPIIAHADVRNMLLASKSYVEGALALVIYAARLLDEHETAPDQQARDDARLMLDLLTPVVKSWPSKWGLVANDHAIQVHGGYGYTREYPVEQFYRDNRLNPIHEGTHGMHAQDLLGRKVRMQSGRGLSLLTGRMRAAAANCSPAYPALSSQLGAAVDRLEEVTEQVWAAGDRRSALANAGLYLDATGHVVVAWLWLEQLEATTGKQGTFYEGKRAAAHYFFDYELPTALQRFATVSSLNQTFVELDDRCL